jgi:WhiB family redox-sensing transcriptional regulator
MAQAACIGESATFFAPAGERPEARELREDKARAICGDCPVLSPCRGWARHYREYGFWGGESEEERAAAGFPRGEGKPVQPRPDRSSPRRTAERAAS